MNKKRGIDAYSRRNAGLHADRTVREYLASLSPEKLTELVIEDLKEQRQRRENGDHGSRAETASVPRPSRPIGAQGRLRPTALRKA